MNKNLLSKQLKCCYNRITFCGFPGNKPVPPGWFKICVGFISGTPDGSTESGFMEKPGIEPATPGLQCIGLSPTPQRLESLAVQLQPNTLKDFKNAKSEIHNIH